MYKIDNSCHKACYKTARNMLIVDLIALIITGSYYISYSIKATKNNVYILTHYKKYKNFSMTTFTQENKTCVICVIQYRRICYQYDKVRDPESVLRNIINEMQYNYTKSFYINRERTECHENIYDLLKTVDSFESRWMLNAILIMLSVICFILSIILIIIR